ncbi:MAG: response regulator transcription factor [Gammaproteobacteria bacterium]
MKCLVIEDDSATAEYICNGLREAGHDPCLCQSGLDGLARAVEEDWDVVVLDRMLPGGVDGLSIVERMRALEKPTPVVVVSALTAIDERVRGLRAGGDDYLSKPFAFSELMARIEALARRAGRQPERRWLQVADLVFDLQARRVTRSGSEIPLQPRELRLLEYLMRHEGQLVTRAMLLEGVWDCHFEPQTNVVNMQISRLRSKLDRDFTPPLIHTVRGAGYRFGPDA